MIREIPIQSYDSVEDKDASELRIAGLTRFTTIDFPGCLSAVAFLRGCPWKCIYCQNPELQKAAKAEGDESVTWDYFELFLTRRKGLIDGVVFSGGEPCADPALLNAVKATRSHGYKIGLHTGGMYPRKLKALLPYLDWVGLDIKAPLNDEAAYDAVVGRRSGVSHVIESLAMLVESGIAFEARTTAHPDYLNEEQLLALAADLKERGVKDYALQIYRVPHELFGTKPLPRVGSDYPSEATVAQIRSMFAKFTLRRS